MHFRADPSPGLIGKGFFFLTHASATKFTSAVEMKGKAKVTFGVFCWPRNQQP